MIAVFLSHIPHHGTEPIKQRTVGAKVKPFPESAKLFGRKNSTFQFNKFGEDG